MSCRCNEVCPGSGPSRRMSRGKPDAVVAELGRAVQFEEAAMATILELRAAAVSDALRRALDAIVETERGHVDRLNLVHERLVLGFGWPSSWDAPAHEPITEPRRAGRKRPGGMEGLDGQVLASAIKLERECQRFFGQMRRSSLDSDARDLYAKIQSEEQGHVQILLDCAENIR